MRVLAVFPPKLLVAGANVPCQRKKPTTKIGNVQSSIVLQETFIGSCFMGKVDTNSV